MASKKLYWAATALLLAMFVMQEGIQANATAMPHDRAMLQHQASRHLKTMVFYMHDLPTAPMPTAVLVAAPKDNHGRPALKLGATFIFDDKLTKGPDPKSTEVGRGQGLYALASLTSTDLLLTFTVVLHKPAMYNGSTICLHGSDRIALPEREISVVGGTGVFRFARGYAILSTIYVDGLNAIIKFNLTMLL